MRNEVALNEIKNKFRGVVSTFRSKTFIKDKKTSDTAILRQGIKSLYMDCRVKLVENDFHEINSWINKSIISQLPEYHNDPIGYEDLKIISANVEPTDLATEITWIVNRLSFEYKKINKYLSYKKNIESLILEGNYEDALIVLAKKEKELGVSFWSIQLKIAVIQTIQGLEAQKQYTSDVRTIWPGGVLSYVTYFTSVRNEERTSLVKFNQDMKGKLKGNHIAEELKDYLSYRILGTIPVESKGLAFLLQIEQLGTIYDLYETLTNVLLQWIKPNRISSLDHTVNKGLKKLVNITDPKLCKINYHLTGDKGIFQLTKRNTHLSDLILSGDNESVIKAYKSFNQKSDHHLDIWNYIYLGCWLALSNRENKVTSLQPHKLHQIMGSALSDNNMSDKINALVKMSANYGGLTLFGGIFEWLSFILKPSSEETNQWSFHLISAHSQFFGVEDVPLGIWLDNATLSIPTSQTYSFWSKRALDPVSREDEPCHITIIKCLALLASNDTENCLKLLPEEINPNIAPLFQLIYCQMKLYALSFQGSRTNIIKLINQTVPYSHSILDIVSFQDALIDFEFDDYASTENVLDAPIALFVGWAKTEQSKLLSYACIATKKAIKQIGVDKPSELINEKSKFHKAQLIYFLHYICVPQVIDHIKAIKGTKTVLNERQNICKALCHLDPLNHQEYELEWESIADDLIMEAGKRVVDRTRIYVDMEAHSRWLFKELKEDYERYKDLLDIKLTKNQDYKEILDDFLQSDNATKTTFVPDNEADAVLLSLVARASNDFLTNPKYGLDYYLSKRIRHQSFIGLIRSHLEFSNIITTRESEDKDFEYNHAWVDKFKSLSQCKKDELNELLAIFAKDFDDQLINVRDNIFQLNTEDCPTGLIKIDFNLQTMSLLKHFILETDASFNDFVQYANIFLWSFLQPSLDKTKAYIKNELKPVIMHSADKLKANARKISGHDSAFDDFELTLTENTAAVQRSLEDVMAWFTPLVGLDMDSIIISIQKGLNLSISASLDMLRPFKPKIKIKVDNVDDVKLRQHELTFINDTIFILLDNIKSHSGIKAPVIEITVLADKDKGTITIICTNETKASEREKIVVEINKSKKLIGNGSLGDRPKTEGKSGFFKLAASIDKSSKGELDFYLQPDGNFFLSITNDLHVVSIEQEQLEYV